MEGYLLLDERGAKLTRNLTWSDKQDEGWLWTVPEVEYIVRNSKDIGILPAYYQSARLVEEDGDVNVEVLGEPEAL